LKGRKGPARGIHLRGKIVVGSLKDRRELANRLAVAGHLGRLRLNGGKILPQSSPLFVFAEVVVSLDLLLALGRLIEPCEIASEVFQT
jgi:hypothetical protein